MNWWDRYCLTTVTSVEEYQLQLPEEPDTGINVEQLPEDLSGSRVAWRLRALPQFPVFPGGVPWWVSYGFGLLAVLIWPILLPFYWCVGWRGKRLLHQLEAQSQLATNELPPSWGETTAALRDSEWSYRTADGEAVRERDHLFLGTVPGTSVPLLLHESLIRHNGHILGPAGSGKSYRVIGGLAPQMVERGAHVVIISCKQDPTMVKYGAHVARCLEVPFKLCTINPTQPSHGFNFHLMTHWAKLTPSIRTQVEVAALGLDESTMTSGNYFPTKNEEFYKPLWVHHSPRNYPEGILILKDHAYSRKHNFTDRDRDHASFLTASIARIADIVPLNILPEHVEPEVIEQQLDISRDILPRPGITYFDLPADLQSTVTKALGKMITQHLMAAASVHEGPRVPVIVFIDDAPTLIDHSIDVTLRHCRSFQISLWFAHQTMADLRVGRADYSHSVTSNAHVKIYFAGGDPAIVEHLEKTSGKKVKPAGGFRGYQGLDPNREPEWLAPGIDSEDVLAISMMEGVAFVDARPATGLTRLLRPAMVHIRFPISRAMFQKIEAMPWPIGGPGTITAIDYKPPTAPPRPKGKTKDITALLDGL